MDAIETKIEYFYKKISDLEVQGNSLIEFVDGVGVFLHNDHLYYAYFLEEEKFSCKGLCLNKDCASKDLPIHFVFKTPLDTARFIVYNMISRGKKVTNFL